MRVYKMIALLLLALMPGNGYLFSQKIIPVLQDKEKKTLTISDSSGDLLLHLTYSGGCHLDKIVVKGVEVTGDGKTAYSGIRLAGQSYTSARSSTAPVVAVRGNVLKIGAIKFGEPALAIEEEWIFTIHKKDIQWRINRRYINEGVVEENDFPCWQFNSMQTWDGALLDNGGVAWNRFLDQPGDAYGVQAGTLTFWNKTDNHCLRITPNEDPTSFRTATFMHRKEGVFSVVQSSSTEPVATKYGLRRFLQTGQYVFAPIPVKPSVVSVQYTLHLNLVVTLQDDVYTGIYDQCVV